MVRARLLFARLFRRGRHHEKHLSSALEVTSAMRIRWGKRKSPGPSLEERVDALEVNFGYLETETRERAQELNADLKAMGRKVTEMRAELDAAQSERERRRREELRVSVALQAWGTVLFALGATLSVLGAVL